MSSFKTGREGDTVSRY